MILLEIDEEEARAIIDALEDNYINTPSWVWDLIGKIEDAIEREEQSSL